MLWPWKKYSAVIDVGMSDPHPLFYDYSAKEIKRLLELKIVHPLTDNFQFSDYYSPEVAEVALSKPHDEAVEYLQSKRKVRVELPEHLQNKLQARRDSWWRRHR